MISAVILAAGSGSRMGSGTPKQFLEIDERPLVWYSLRAFSKTRVEEIILVTQQEDVDDVRREIVDKYGFSKVKQVVPGGSERFLSVEQGLMHCRKDADTVIIHDGARPLVTPEIIERVLRDAEEYGAATAAMPVKDTIKVVDPQGFGVETPDRRRLCQIQTPQAFRRDLLVEAFEKRRREGATDITDDTMLVERYTGVFARMTEGSYRNLKVTTPEDLPIAELFLHT